MSRPVVFAALAAVALLTAALLVAQVQVQVAADSDAASRGCGSAIDALTGRSGWERWWSADLDEPVPAGDEQLLRTRTCPGAVNEYMFAASTLAAAGFAGLVFAAVLWSRNRPTAAPPSMRRLGASVVAGGVLLTVGGVIGLGVLVADPESTLFIYVDRLVVVALGLVVLVPAFALIAIGGVIMLLADRLPLT